MSKSVEHPAGLPVVTLADRDGFEEDYVVLSGDPGSRGKEGADPKTARFVGDGVELCDWYWSPFSERWLPDPDSWVRLDGEEVRALRRFLASSPSEPGESQGGAP